MLEGNGSLTRLLGLVEFSSIFSMKRIIYHGVKYQFLIVLLEVMPVAYDKIIVIYFGFLALHSWYCALRPGSWEVVEDINSFTLQGN